MSRGWWRRGGPQPRNCADGVRVPLRSGDIALGLLLAFLLVVALLSLTKLRTEDTAEYADPGWDRHVYIAMADGHGFDFGIAPFNRRVLVPALAAATPGSLQVGFFAVSASFAVVAGAAMFALGRLRGHSRSVAAAGTLLLFSFGWGLKYALADFWIPDAAVLAFVGVGMVFAQQRRALAFAVVVATGVLAKESVLFVIPLYYSLNAARFVDWRLARETGLAALPAVAVFLLLQVTIPERNGDAAYISTLPEIIQRFPELYANYDYYSLLRDIGYHQRLSDRNFEALSAMTVNPFGLIAPALAAVGLRRHGLLALRLLPFFALVYLQLLFATDTERLLELAAPCLCLMAMAGMDELSTDRPWIKWPLFSLAVGAFALVLIEPNVFTTDWRVQGALAAVVVGIAAAGALRPPKISLAG